MINKSKFKEMAINMKNDSNNIMAKALALAPLGALGIAQSVFADTTVGPGQNGPSVGNDGTVSFQGGNTDIKTGAGSAMKWGTFFVGLVIGIAGITLVGYGAWYGWQASRDIQKGNSEGYSSVGKVVAGTIIGGLLLASGGLFLSVGAATSGKLFG